MASNVDKYLDTGEHAAINHTGIPGVGGGGATTIVGAEVIESDANMGTALSLTKTIPANKLTADDQIIEVWYNASTNASPSSGNITFGGVTIFPNTSVGGTIHGVSYHIRVTRTGATTARSVVQRMDGIAGTGDVENTSFTLDWSLARDFVFTWSLVTTHEMYQALKWPEAGAIGIAGIGSDTLPTGTIVPYGGTVASIPVGFLPCDGSLADQTVEADLFAVIGATWNVGGEPGGFFRLPDFRGKSVVGLNDGSLPNGVDGGFTTRTLAAVGGAEVDPGHTHVGGSHTHNISSNPLVSVPTGTTSVQSGAGASVPSNTHTHTLDNTATDGGGVVATASGGGSVMHPFAVCPYIIKSKQVGGGIGVTAQNNAGPLQGIQPTLNFIPSGAAGITVVDNPGQNRIDVTISAPAAAPAGISDIRARVSNFTNLSGAAALNKPSGVSSGNMRLWVFFFWVTPGTTGTRDMGFSVAGYDGSSTSDAIAFDPTTPANFQHWGGGNIVLMQATGTIPTWFISGSGAGDTVTRQSGSELGHAIYLGLGRP